MSIPAISETEIRAMIRLVGDVAAFRDSPIEKRRVLMDGLVKLVGADCWWWSLANRDSPASRPNFTTISHGGFEDGSFVKLLAAMSFPGSWHVFTCFFQELDETDIHLTRTRLQMDLDGQFDQPETKRMWRAAGVADLMISARPLESGGHSAVGIYRSGGASPFKPRDARLAHMLLTEVSWLHELGWTDAQNKVLPKLSPRRRTVLNLMLEGQSRKTIASSLRISIHTVDGYVKDIFRLFGVHSQAELIARFRSGESSATPESGD